MAYSGKTMSDWTAFQDHLAHHAANFAAVTFPIMSLWLHGPEILSVTLTLIGLVWYGVLFYDRFIRRDKNENSR